MLYPNVTEICTFTKSIKRATRKQRVNKDIACSSDVCPKSEMEMFSHKVIYTSLLIQKASLIKWKPHTKTGIEADLTFGPQFKMKCYIQTSPKFVLASNPSSVLPGNSE